MIVVSFLKRIGSHSDIFSGFPVRCFHFGFVHDAFGLAVVVKGTIFTFSAIAILLLWW